jgi:hypothetical protein
MSNNLTAKETAVLAAIYASEYNSNGDDGTPCVWTFSVSVEGMNVNAINATLGSLEKKGIVSLGEMDGDETVTVTEAGVAEHAAARAA